MASMKVVRAASSPGVPAESAGCAGELPRAVPVDAGAVREFARVTSATRG
jgi:hypothetical protein